MLRYLLVRKGISAKIMTLKNARPLPPRRPIDKKFFFGKFAQFLEGKFGARCQKVANFLRNFGHFFANFWPFFPDSASNGEISRISRNSRNSPNFPKFVHFWSFSIPEKSNLRIRNRNFSRNFPKFPEISPPDPKSPEF